ncbi:TPA: hypothetical protein DCZ39_08675 [Patescibacteria group bacterium]|nr:hypothetical protein [Candidatus Gracilibacteria bacterium]
MTTINFINNENLIVSFRDEEVSIVIDDAIYPHSKKIKELLNAMDYSDQSKQLANTIRAKELVWQLHETLRQHINQLGTRDPDYVILEQEYKDTEKANLFLFQGIQYLQGKTHEFTAEFANPITRMN